MNSIWKSRLKLMVFMGIPLGMAMLFIQYYFNFSEEQIMHYYTWGAIITITVSLVTAMYFQIRLSKRVMAAQKALQEDGDIDLYLVKMEDLLKKTHIVQNKNILRLNMSVAYVDKKDFKGAVEILRQIDSKTLKGDLKPIYFNNLVHYLFRLEENGEAIELMEANEASFATMEAKTGYRGGFMLNRALKLIAEGETTEALDLLEEHEDLFLDNHLSESYAFVLSKI